MFEGLSSGAEGSSQQGEQDLTKIRWKLKASEPCIYKSLVLIEQIGQWRVAEHGSTRKKFEKREAQCVDIAALSWGAASQDVRRCRERTPLPCPGIGGGLLIGAESGLPVAQEDAEVAGR